MTRHSQVGASNMYRWSACPGSVRLCAGVENRSSKYAEEGTAAHEFAAARLTGSTFITPPDKETWDAVDTYVRHCYTLMQGCGQCLEDGWWVEVSFDLSKFHPGLFGTADFVALDQNTQTLHVVDYKHGAGVPVEVIGNQQLRYYALGAFIQLGVKAKRIRMTVVQPRCPHPDGPIRSEEIDVVDLLDFAAELVDAVKATESADAPLVVGSHCRWCPAAAICPETKRVAFESVAKDFKASPDILAEVLGHLDEIEAWCKSVRAFAYDEAQVGRCPPGWKLVSKRATRRWADEQEAKVWLLSRNFTRPEIFEEPTLKSPAQIEKLDGVTPELKSEMTELIVAESSGTKLVKASDPAPAVEGVKSLFSPVTSD